MISLCIFVRYKLTYNCKQLCTNCTRDFRRGVYCREVQFTLCLYRGDWGECVKGGTPGGWGWDGINVLMVYVLYHALKNPRRIVDNHLALIEISCKWGAFPYASPTSIRIQTSFWKKKLFKFACKGNTSNTRLLLDFVKWIPVIYLKYCSYTCIYSTCIHVTIVSLYAWLFEINKIVWHLS